MSNFKMMVSAIVADAQRELNMEQASQEKLESVLDSVQFHKAIDKLASEFNKDSKLDSTTHYTYRKVMSGYDSRYMDKNDFRFASKTYNKSEHKDTSTEYFDYLLKSQYGSDTTVARERKVITESYDFDMSHTEDKLPWKKVAKKPTTVSKASVRKLESLPQNTYLHDAPATSSTSDYKPSKDNYQSVKVVGYKMYKKAIVLDVITENDKRACGRFDEIIDNYERFRDSYKDIDSRNADDNKKQIQHIVFRYVPFDRFGKPNKYDGINQLREFFHTQKFIMEQGFTRVKDILDFIIGYTLDIPNVYAYSNISRNDLATVYSVFGDFDDFENEFSEDLIEYHPISEYTLRDKDSESTENIHESLLTPNYYPIIISYECHKEFRTQLELEYSHIGAIFD